jgi:molybdopterin molybdotransferase
MLSVIEAMEIVRTHVTPLPAQKTPLGPEVLGCLLAEDITSDLDLPPFDKAMMDGFALRSADLRDGTAELTIIEEIPAGKTPTKTVGTMQASRIMTGAPTPVGADAVVMIENCQIDGNRVRVQEPRIKARLNILDRAKEMRNGETVLRAGTTLRPQELGLLAAVGRTSVLLQRPARVAVLPTGDEIVPPDVKPGPGQIRNSNGAMLVGQVQRAGGVPTFLGIARDEAAHLRTLISQGLESDVLILSGGVSAGKLDLVPGVLEELGVKALFHKVAMKPGKPVLFGVKDNKLVFGLPGNPVSSLVCFELFVRVAIRRLMAQDPGPSWIIAATLAKDYAYRTDRPTYHPAWLHMTEHGPRVEPVPWFGSPDLRGVMSANAFMVIQPGDHQFKAGGRFEVLCVEDIEWSPASQ